MTARKTSAKGKPGQPAKYPVRVVTLGDVQDDGTRRVLLEVTTAANGFRTRWEVTCDGDGELVVTRNADQDAITRHRMALLQSGPRAIVRVLSQQELFPKNKTRKHEEGDS